MNPGWRIARVRDWRRGGGRDICRWSLRAAQDKNRFRTQLLDAAGAEAGPRMALKNVPEPILRTCHDPRLDVLAELMYLYIETFI